MQFFKPYTLNLGGRLLSVDSPLVMGILNTTPDSFYAGSRCDSEELIRNRIRTIVSQGADIIDIGGYSSRSNADDITPEEEFRRLSLGLRLIKEEAPDSIVSVDTFRASVAERCVGEYGVDIINDIASGGLDPQMIPTVARLKVPYIMMHMRGNPHTMTQLTDYTDVTADVVAWLGAKAKEAALAGVTDIIVDPGFGLFSKTVEQNYEMLAHLELFATLDLPLLVGVSRKSMIYKLLSTTPDNALNGTTAIHMISLMKGASILRVHDVAEAREAVTIFNATFSPKNH